MQIRCPGKLRNTGFLATPCVWRVVSLLLGGAMSGMTLAAAPIFSHMTLNEIHAIAITVEDVERDLAVYGLTAERVRGVVRDRLRGVGIEVVDYETAVATPRAGLLRVRIITNRDAQGFYHLSVKFELRQKIPLSNSANGFVSQAVWSDAQNGVMLASEVEKIDALVDELLGNFLTAFQAQNRPTDSP